MGVDSLWKIPSIADCFEVWNSSGGGECAGSSIHSTDAAFSTGRKRTEGRGRIVIFLIGKVFR